MRMSTVFIGTLFVFLLSAHYSFASTTSRLTIPLSRNVVVVLGHEDGINTQTTLISDNLSSIKVVLDADGVATSIPTYYPYGTEKDDLSGSVNNRYYTGQRKVDHDDSLYNYNARYYSPEVGIFTQPDPVEGLNRFAYVGGNPAMRNDPTGKCVNCDAFWMKGITAEHPWIARPRDEAPELHDFARINAWTGNIADLLIAMDMQDNGLDTMIKQSRQYVSKSEAEAAFLVSTAVNLTIGPEGIGKIGKLDEISMVGAEALSTTDRARLLAEDSWAQYRSFFPKGNMPKKSPGCLTGHCGFASETTQAVSGMHPGVNVKMVQVNEILGQLGVADHSAFHYFAAADIDGVPYLIDHSFSQFVNPNLTTRGSNAVQPLTRQLLRDGFIPLTEDTFGTYLEQLIPKKLGPVSPSLIQNTAEHSASTVKELRSFAHIFQ